jgi:catechol 2,3-dioxygenase-like lactoylglutathione lyase family enzyme
MPVPIRQIAEVAIVVGDLDRSVRFYTDVLGLLL